MLTALSLIMSAVTAFEEGFSCCIHSASSVRILLSANLGSSFSGKTHKVTHSIMFLSLSGSAVLQTSSALGHTLCPGHLSSTSCALKVQESLVKPACLCRVLQGNKHYSEPAPGLYMELGSVSSSRALLTCANCCTCRQTSNPFLGSSITYS